jgi:hypothetical protein
MATVLMLDLTQSQASNPAARAAAADVAQSQASARAELAQLRAEMMRAQAEARLAQAEGARAQAEAMRAHAEAARARQGGTTAIPRGPSGPTRRQEGMIFAGFLVLTMAAVVVLLPLVRAFSRRLEGSKRDVSADIDTSAQLQRIEHTVEAMAIEIERLSEGQRFTTKLLANRAEAENLIPRR